MCLKLAMFAMLCVHLVLEFSGCKMAFVVGNSRNHIYKNGRSSYIALFRMWMEMQHSVRTLLTMVASDQAMM